MWTIVGDNVLRYTEPCMIFLLMNFTTVEVLISANASASAHFVKYSVAVNINDFLLFSPVRSSRGPTTSKAHMANGHGDTMGWREDRTGEIKRKSFVLTATEYFTKWAEAEAFAEIKVATMVKFINRNIIARFGVP